MALQFPTSSIQGDTYQSGSSAVYEYDNEKWVVKQPPEITLVLATSASYLVGSLPTLVQAQNTSGQSIATGATEVIDGWTNVLAENATEWNATTGVFTATKAGTYLVSANLTYAARSTNQTGNIANVQIVKNSTILARVITPALNTASIQRGLGTATVIVKVAVGDTIAIRSSHDFGATATLSTSAGHNSVSIQEIPSRIQR
jgi:hypothetical protein